MKKNGRATTKPTTITTLADLKPDQKNANKGTSRGRAMLESSAAAVDETEWSLT